VGSLGKAEIACVKARAVKIRMTTRRLSPYDQSGRRERKEPFGVWKLSERQQGSEWERVSPIEYQDHPRRVVYVA